MKKLLVLAFLPILLVSAVAHAQVTAGVTGSGTGIVSTPITSGFVQFDNLTVQGLTPASAQGSLGTIVATAQGTTSANTTLNVTVPCFQFQSQSASIGTSAPCPVPPTASGTSAIYNINISGSTELLLSNRATATLSDFAPGDTINVFGYYNADGSIQASIVRNLSNPGGTTNPSPVGPTQAIQLDNVTLNSMSGTVVPATLAVTQAIGLPCYGFANDGSESTIACPVGISAFSDNTATANVTPLASLVPVWQSLHKYVVNINANTTILDRNRNSIPLSSLSTGDSLNVYGVTSDGGQTVTANIVRDLSIPATASEYTGTVTQVNADGSFVIQTNNGQTLTVQSPVTVGATVAVQGVLNATDSTISQVWNIRVDANNTTNAVPATN